MNDDARKKIFEEFKEMYVEELHYLNSNFSDINPSIPFMTEDNIQTISNKMWIFLSASVREITGQTENPAEKQAAAK